MQEYCISVIIPVYNCEKYIHRCLDSLRFQNFTGRFEIIIVDDGSTDNTLSSCSAIISNLNIPYVLIRQANLGASAARNAGIRVAKGEYLIFVDGDDALEPDALRKLYDLASINHVELAYGCFRKVSENGRLLWIYRPGKKYYGRRNSCELLADILNGRMLVRLGAFIVTKNCLTGNGIEFYEGCRYGEDMEFIIKCLINVKQVYGTGAFIYDYFENAGSVMGSVDFERFEFVEALKRLDTHLVKVSNKGGELSELLFHFFIPYGILYHIDELLTKKIPSREIKDFLNSRKYDELLQIACLPGARSRIARKAKLWRDKPEIYGKGIYNIRKIKLLSQKTFPIMNLLKCIRL